MSKWIPISDSGQHDLERVMACGWQRPSKGGTAGYWWYHEDVIVEGKCLEKPHATFYVPLSHILPPMPDKPTP